MRQSSILEYKFLIRKMNRTLRILKRGLLHLDKNYLTELIKRDGLKCTTDEYIKEAEMLIAALTFVVAYYKSLIAKKRVKNISKQVKK